MYLLPKGIGIRVCKTKHIFELYNVCQAFIFNICSLYEIFLTRLNHFETLRSKRRSKNLNQIINQKFLNHAYTQFQT